MNTHIHYIRKRHTQKNTHIQADTPFNYWVSCLVVKEITRHMNYGILTANLISIAINSHFLLQSIHTFYCNQFTLSKYRIQIYCISMHQKI